MMPKFVLIDHSICDLSGHHFQYAVHVLRAAEQAGFEPILATNRKFRPVTRVSATVYPVYEFGFWPESTASVASSLRLAQSARRAWFRWRCNWRYSIFGLAWLGRFDWRRHLMRRPATLSRLPEFALGIALVGLFKLARTFVLLLLVPAGAVALAVSSLWWGSRKAAELLAPIFRSPGESRVQHATERYFRALSDEAKTYVDFFRSVWRVSGWWRHAGPNWVGRQLRRRQSEAFGRDTRALLRRVGAGAGDVFFIPTISPADMLGLAQVFKVVPQARDATWHLLFRRNICVGRRAEYDTEDRSLEGLRRAFRALREESASANLFLYTDTAELTEQHNRLGAFPFHTLPIPHTYSPQDRPSRGGPLRITYLGDARYEKGFHLLPRIAGDLNEKYLETGRACFVVQCNYNVPGGEPEAVIARPELESFDPRFVTLHKQPLTSEEYRDLLLSADINLLLYDPANYYARSSGILIESLAAGIPVVVPAGTWLARQFLGAYYRHQDSLRERFPVLASCGHDSLWWLNKAGVPEQPTALEAAPAEETHCWLQIPAGATHLLVRVVFGEAVDTAVFHFDQGRWSGSLLDRTRTVLIEPEAIERRATCLAPLLPGARQLSFGISTGRKDALADLRSLTFDFLAVPAGESAPLGAVGLVYTAVNEISDLLRDMIDNHAHYERTARECGERLRDYHNPGRLLSELLRAPASAQRAVEAAV